MLYQIESKAGVVFGVYEAPTAREAWDAMVREVGSGAEGAFEDWIVRGKTNMAGSTLSIWRITIYREHDGVNEWAGSGRVVDGRIRDCTADIGEDVYEWIEDQIAAGEMSGTVGRYSWDVTRASEEA